MNTKIAATVKKMNTWEFYHYSGITLFVIAAIHSHWPVLMGIVISLL